MKNKYILIWFAICHILLYSCTTGDYVSFDPSPRAATAPEKIEVVYSNLIKKEYKIIGIVSANTYSMENALERMRYDASEMGAEALLDFGPNGSQTAVGASNGYISNFGNPYIINTMQTSVATSYNTGFSAKAIVWESIKNDEQENRILVSDFSYNSLNKNLSQLPSEYKNNILDVYSEFKDENKVQWIVTVKPPKKGYRKIILSNGNIISDSPKFVIINTSKIFNSDIIKTDSSDILKRINNLVSDRVKSVSRLYFFMSFDNRHASPAWTIWLYGPNEFYYGEIKIDAVTGKIISNELS